MFVVFLFASSLYMLTVLAIHRICKRDSLLSPRMQHSYAVKLMFFVLTMLFIALLIYHIYFHRLECRPNAFSWFSATEYGIAIANMGFHMTAAYDFQDLMLTTTLRKPYSE
ncbi:hypothetical protein CRM22_006293 [Opisthorchis felineus]|uniref:CWH43-like N-terminal domain-containing protein n=1 Tax=Opisthorchis felineus TaxID=147828 RepID=A0A4S2LLT5_OPIFE|nr:hypothetical protein CRM22_006293 [Opisthorchis felineus]